MLYYKRKEELIEAELEEDLVMLDIEQGKYFSLNPVARRIWDLLSQPRSKKELVSILLDEYEIDEESCDADVQTCLNKLKKANLLHE